MVKVSVIIPVYNVEKYLRECLDSVQKQTLEELEIICVDDGSTDSSGRILDEYGAKDDRFHVIHKQNEGYGRAVNVGIEAATAPYLGIVESDDMIVPHMYECLYNLMEEIRVDVIKSDYYEFYENTEGEYIQEYVPLTTNEFYYGLYETVLNIRKHQEALLFQKYTWSGLYNTAFLRREHIVHNETPGASYQDNGFWFQTMVKADTVYFARRAFYKYRIDNPNSSTYSKGKVFSVCDEYDFIHGILDGMGKEGEPFYRWATLFRIRGCINNIQRVAEEYREALAQRTKEDFMKALCAGEVDAALFSDPWKIRIFGLIANPQKYVAQAEENREIILRNTKGFHTVIIYGAGKIGRRVQALLKEGRENTKIKYFAVTDLEENRKEVLGIPVKKIDDLKSYAEDALVIISVGQTHMATVEKNLKTLGFQHFISYSELIRKQG